MILDIFPVGALSSSVITTVWVGIIVVAFFNLRFGWVLSGLVVPGYMVPLLMIKPYSAILIFVEGIITYLLVKAYSSPMARIGNWSEVFGRDRFLAIVIVSVIVRLVFDIFIIPSSSAWLSNNYQIYIDYQNDLHSFGLIIISLIANQLWKSGAIRGLPPLIVTVATTFIIIRYGLMEYTNFSLSSIEFVYEDIASSILAAPKAYIILIMSCIIATRMNLYYGWDYAGILIPSLLALQWYQPTKIVATFFEAFIILIICALLLNSKLLKKSNIEGARKLILFFTVGYIYKWLLAFYLLSYHPGIKVTDTYGFGYLLATLLAIKMHDKGIAVRMTRTVVQTSLMGVIGASIIGFSLTLVPLYPAPSTAGSLRETQINYTGNLVSQAEEDKLKLYAAKEKLIRPTLSVKERDGLIQLIRQVRIAESAEQLISSNNKWPDWQVQKLDSHLVRISSTSNDFSHGYLLTNLSEPSQSLISIPFPITNWGALENGAWFYGQLPIRYLLVAGPNFNVERSSNFHDTMAQYLNVKDSITIRTYDSEVARIIAGSRKETSDIEINVSNSTLWLDSAIPKGMKLNRFKNLLPNITINWQRSPIKNNAREFSSRSNAEFFFTRNDMRRLLAYARNAEMLAENPVANIDANKRISGYIQDNLYLNKEKLAEKGSNLYRPPRSGELLYLDEEILSPLLNVLLNEFFRGNFSENGQQELDAIGRNLDRFGYQIINYTDLGTQENFIILSEKDNSNKRYWGTYVFRLGGFSPYMVEIPRPLYERNSFEFGVSYFERTKSLALLIAGTHPKANIDGSADLIRDFNKESLFSLIHQVTLRELYDEPMLVLQTRAYGYDKNRQNSRADALISTTDGMQSLDDANQLLGNLITLMKEDNLTVQLVDGKKDVAGYETHGVIQAKYLDATQYKDFVSIWLSPLARSSYEQQTDSNLFNWHGEKLGIELLEVDLPQHMSKWNPKLVESGLNNAAVLNLKHYAETGNINSLYNAINTEKGAWHRIIDINSKQHFLSFTSPDNDSWAIINTSPRDNTKLSRSESIRLSRQVQAFINSRQFLLSNQIDGVNDD